MSGVHSRGALAAAFLFVLCAFAGAVQAADFRIVAPLRGLIRADTGAGYNLFGPPNISGDFVVFTTRSGPADGIWSYQISTKRIRKLAGFETRAPGGRGRFTAFGNAGSLYPTSVGGDTVVFFARDLDNTLGVYTVGVRGGAVSLIASTTMDVPGGTGPFRELRHASTNGKVVAFYGLTQESATGVFRANVDGTQLRTIIDASKRQLDARTPTGPNPKYYGLFAQTAVGRTEVNFYASGLFDPVSGPNAIFRARGFADLADNMTNLDGGAPAAHVRINGFSAAVGSSRIAIAADEPGTGHYGIFKVDSLNETTAYVTLQDNAPGAGGPFTNLYGFGLDDTGLAFTGTFNDSETRQNVYFVAKPGAKIQRVASGTTYYLPYVGDRSVSEGRIVFTEGVNSTDTFFLATPR